MAQFAKIWTTIFDDEWFVGLNGNQRSIFLQLIILAKRNSDSGQICTRSLQSLANECSVSRQSMTRMLAKMNTKWAGSVQRVGNNRATTGQRPGNGVTVITLPNYKKYQELRAIKSNIGTNNRDKSRAEQNIYIVEQIISDLNEKTGKKFSIKTDSTRKAIEARLKEGRTLEDFQIVHDVKCKEWLGTEMSKFLRPATLYQPAKFETYLNQDQEKAKENHRQMWCSQCFKTTRHENDKCVECAAALSQSKK